MIKMQYLVRTLRRQNCLFNKYISLTHLNNTKLASLHIPLTPTLVRVEGLSRSKVIERQEYDYSTK